MPKGSKIRRLTDGSFNVETPKFTLNFEIDYLGFTTNIPNSFEKYYLGLEGRFTDLSIKSIVINMKISFDFRTLVFGINPLYYQWIESFAKQINGEFEVNEFYKTLNWNSSLLLLRYFEKKSQIS